MKLTRLSNAAVRALARPYLYAAYQITPTKSGLPQRNDDDVISLWLALRPRVARGGKPDFADQFDRGALNLWTRGTGR